MEAEVLLCVMLDEAGAQAVREQTKRIAARGRSTVCFMERPPNMFDVHVIYSGKKSRLLCHTQYYYTFVWFVNFSFQMNQI